MPDKAHNDWDDHVDWSGEKIRKYWEVAEDVVNTCHNQEFDKSILKSVSINIGEIEILCKNNNDLELPKFWFPESEQVKNTKNININLKNSTKLFNSLVETKEVFYDSTKHQIKKMLRII